MATPLIETFHLSRSFRTAVPITARVQAVAAMFGIGAEEEQEVNLYKELAITVGSGKIVLFTGDSGAGKSCAIRDLREQVAADRRFHTMEFSAAGIDPAKPIVDQFGETELKEILDVLSITGLCEAFTYLRTPAQLSDGQRYRFQLALLIHQALRMQAEGDRRVPVIFVDEFLAVLDREVARNIAFQIRRAVSKYKLAAVVATTHSDFVPDLQPNLTVTLRLNTPPELIRKPLAGI